MVDEPDNVTLRLLRDIRAKLGEHDTRFEKLDNTLELMKYQIAQSLGLAMAADIASSHVGDLANTLAARQKRLDEGLADVRRKVAEREARLG